ncbi:hypothetical protein IJ670_00690 [bacterium]|nr:hypothetical protein [bacterium]
MPRKKQNKAKSLIFGLCAFVFFIIFEICFPQYNQNISFSNKFIHEADYVKAYCEGTREYVLDDKTRIDCLEGEFACEYDWAQKWYEGFGQALWYAHNTGKKPCLVLILKTKNDDKYFERAKILADKYVVKLTAIKSPEY